LTGLNKGDVARLIKVLKRDGIIKQTRGRVRLVKPDFDPEQVSLEDEDRRLAYERSRIEMMRGYAELCECRRRYILNYFGDEQETEQCGLCDNDVSNRAMGRVVIHQDQPSDDTMLAESPFPMGSHVVHETLGEGVVQRTTADSVTVLFDDAGYKTLAVEVVQEQNMMRTV
jgi:ATP-dependent DNA helicase RecQ